MRSNQIAWYLWAVGSVLILLSWFGIVSYLVGWIGFVIGMAGSALSWGLRPPSESTSTAVDESPTKLTTTSDEPTKF